MTSWWHSALGKFDPEHGWIGLDYGKLIDRRQADLTLCHETVHSILTMTTECGQACTAIFQQSSLFSHIEKKEVDKIKKLLYEAQWYVQEGSATLMEALILRQMTSKANALQWVEGKLPQKYKEAFSIMIPGFELSYRYRELFTAKIPHLAMQISLRRDAVRDRLFDKPEKLLVYLQQDSNNPNVRLAKLTELVRIKPWVVTKNELEIAKQAGIEYFGPASKMEVADYLNYLLELSGKKPIFTEKDISASPAGSETYDIAYENMIVANMNLGLETAELLPNKVDFFHYADVFRIVFVAKKEDRPKSDGDNILESVIGERFDFSFLGITNTGEKYTTGMSAESAESALRNELSHTTVLTKWGAYSFGSDSFIWWEDIRPKVVAYNTVRDLDAKIGKQLELFPETKFEKIHLQFMENHPLQTLLIRKVGSKTWNILNTYGDKALLALLEKYKDSLTKLDIEQAKVDSRHLNGAFSFWLNLPAQIDWVQMIGQF